MWRKSTYSNPNGECVEVDQLAPDWRKSRRCTAGECVEVASIPAVPDDEVLVRDSQDPAGAVLAFGGITWTAFLATLKSR